MDDARILENTKVTGIKKKDGSVIGVETTWGDIEAEYVVNCGGMWARELGKMAGVNDITTIVKGTQDRKAVTLRMDTWAWPHERWGISGGRLMVDSPSAIVARWLADGRLHRPGVWAPEQVVDGNAFFEGLAKGGSQHTLERGK